MVKKKSKREILIRKAKAATILRKRIAKKDFWAFCLYYDPKFFSKRLFLKKVVEAFMRVYSSYSAGIIYRLAVSMPPRADTVPPGKNPRQPADQKRRKLYPAGGE